MLQDLGIWEDNLPGVSLGAPGAPLRAERWVERQWGRHLPPPPPNPGSISGSGRSAQTSASSTRKQPRWGSYNPAPSPPAEPGQLVTGHPAETPRREAARSLSPPSSAPSFTERPSRAQGETQTGGNARHTVMVCTARTPISPALPPRQGAGPSAAPTLYVTVKHRESHRRSQSLPISSTGKTMLLVATLKAFEGPFFLKKKKAVKHSCFICST